MSEIVSPSPSSSSPGSASGRQGTSVIEQKLAGLRQKITFWLIVDGLSRLLMLVVVMAALDLLIDWLFHLDQIQRTIMLVLMVGTAVVMAYYWLVRPFRKRPNDDALCLQVESKNGGLQQIVISSLQFSRENIDYQARGLSPQMVSATIEQGAAKAREIDFGKTLDSSRFAANVAMLAIASLLIVGSAIGIAMQLPLLDIWFKRNILLGGEEWWRDTYLVVEGVTEDNTLVLVKGEDHNQIVYVRDDSEVVPEKVEIEFREAGRGGARNSEEMKPVENAERTEFSLLFRKVSTRFQFRAVGGRDGRTDWIQVELVDPPRVTSLKMEVDPPDYTKMEPYELPEGSSPYSVYAGSGVQLTGTANKALKSAVLKTPQGDFELEVTDGNQFTLNIPAEQLVAGSYEFGLVDEGGLTPSDPDRFKLQIKQDRAPGVLAETSGISSVVVPRARIPILASATDDFAVTNLKLIYEWKGLEGNSVPQTGEVTFTGLDGFYGEAEVPLRDLFDLELAKIPAGSGLEFRLVAMDNDAVSGAKEGSSDPIFLRVVTELEFRENLLRRESEQRQELERLLKMQEDLLINSSAMLADVRSKQDPLEQLIPQMRSDLQRDLNVQQNLTETIGQIASRFEAFLEEVNNNRIDEEKRTLQNRLSGEIIVPLRNLEGFDAQDAQRGISLSRRSLEDEVALESALQETVDVQEAMVETIKQILTAMEKSEGFQEAINLLREIKQGEEDVLQAARQRREQRLKDILNKNQGDQDQDDNKDDGAGDSGAGDDNGDGGN